MPPARSPSIVVGVVVLLFCSSVVFAALCKPAHYWEQRLQRCEPCKKCLAPDLIVLRYCEIYSDTVCGPQSRLLEVLSASKDELMHWRRHQLNSSPAESSFGLDQGKRSNASLAVGEASLAAAAAASDAQLSQIFTFACFLIFTVLIFAMMAIICVLQYRRKKECTVLIEHEGGGGGGGASGVGLLMGTRQLATRNRLNPTDQFHTLTQIDCTPAMDKILEERRRNVRRHLPHLNTCENIYVDPTEHLSKRAAAAIPHSV